MAVSGKISCNSVQGIGSSRIGKYSGAFGETVTSSHFGARGLGSPRAPPVPLQAR